MRSTQSSFHFSKKIIAVGLALSCSVLTACSGDSDSAEIKGAEPIATEGSSSAAQGPTPLEISPTLKSSTVPLSCEQVVPLETLYSFNPNYALDLSQSPRPDTPAKQIQDLRGVVCTYVNLTTGEIVQIAVAQLDPAGIKEIDKKLQATSTPTHAFTSEVPSTSYFSVENGTGISQVLTDKYWIVCTSQALGTPEDMAPLMDAAITNSSTQ